LGEGGGRGKCAFEGTGGNAECGMKNVEFQKLQKQRMNYEL
jgi:hypothetical protein